jgi:hypothetical protein
MPTNDERAERARVILEAYGMYVGNPDDDKANLTDVLADLMHLSVRQRALGIEFNHRLEMARQHFEAETEEERNGIVD